MPNPDAWHILLRDYFMHHALKREQAEECVAQVFLRYSAKAGAPAWGIDVPPPLFWRLARDVLCEHWRQQQRQRQLVQKLHKTLTETPPARPEMLAIDRLDAERFAHKLPDRLREVLELRLQGYTCAEIAKQLSLSPGTVKAYLAELRKKFVRYYGYDPTKRGSCGGIVCGSLSGAAASASHREGGRQNPLEEVSGLDDGRSVRGKRVRPAPHPRRARRARGGETDPTSLLLNSGCGCGGEEPALSQKLADRGSEYVLPPSNAHLLLLGTAILQPLAATCIEVHESCTSQQTLTQYRCQDQWWLPTCLGQFERYKRWKYRWQCGNCWVVRCCPWTPDGCCTNLEDPPCQGNDPPCARPACDEPAVNCE